MSAHRYWRLNIYYSSNAATTCSIAEWELRSSEGGSDLIGSGSISANDVTWGAADNAVDGDSGTIWGPWMNPSWIAYDFGEGNSYDIVETVLTARNDAFYYQTPRNFNLEYSDNGSDWEVLYTFRHEEFTQGETRVFNSSDNSSVIDVEVGSYRYWRIFFDHSPSNASSASACEVELRETSGGADATGSGTPSASSDYGASYSADKAFDDDTDTFWLSASPSLTPYWLKYDFGEGNEKTIREVYLKIRDDAYYAAQDIIDLRVQVSSDDTNWSTVYYEYGQGGWSKGSSATYLLSAASTTTTVPLGVTTTTGPPTEEEDEGFVVGMGSISMAEAIGKGIRALR